MRTTPPRVDSRADQLLKLICAAVPFCASVLAYADAGSGRLRPLAGWGYREDVSTYLITDFIEQDPVFASVAAAPERSLFWEDVPHFREGPSARTVLSPCGFDEGTSMVLLGDAGHMVGAIHLSLADRAVPAHARSFLRQVRPELTAIAAAGAARASARLSEREVEVLHLLARGLSNPQIAAELTISRSTTGTHVENILAKLGVTSRVDAVVKGIHIGLVKSDVVTG